MRLGVDAYKELRLVYIVAKLINTRFPWSKAWQCDAFVHQARLVCKEQTDHRDEESKCREACNY